MKIFFFIFMEKTNKWITMATSSDALNEILGQQQKQFEKSQIHLLTTLKQQFQMQMAAQSNCNSSPNDSVDLSANNIPGFMCNPTNNITFSLWFKCWRDLRARFFHTKKTHRNQNLFSFLFFFVLLRTLSTKVDERFTNFILPTQPSRLTFTETVNQLTGILGDK